MYDRDAVLAATDLVALADELLGPHRGPISSPKWRCPNPQHDQTGRTPPLGVSRARRGEQWWRCYTCGEGGTAIDLVMAVEGVPFLEALKTLAARAGIAPDDGRSPGRPRFHQLSPPPPPVLADPEGLARYVEDCATRLWSPRGSLGLRWLTEVRGLPEDVLRRNRIGVDIGKHHQPRPDAVPETVTSALVFPFFEDGQAIYAQLRLLHPTPELRYLNLKAELAPNPHVGTFHPVEQRGRCVVVTEGPTDGLAAAAAGYETAVVLGTGTARLPSVAERLAGLGKPLAVAFDAETSGDQGAERLLEGLTALGAEAVRVSPPSDSDLGQWLLTEPDWPPTLSLALTRAFARIAARPPLALGR